MENGNGRIYYGTGIDNSQLRADAAEARNVLQGIGTSASQEGDRIDAAMKKIGASVAGVFAVSKVKDFIVQVANVRGQFQQLEAAFKVLTGDAAIAENLMSQLIHTAATTPFGVTDISNAARQLLAYGVEADKVNETLIRLGDICAGLSIPIGDLAYLYGTTMTQGRLYTADLNQFLGRGIPLADELAKQFGVAKEEIKKMVEEGKVGFPEVQQAIINLTNEGGKFGGLMEAQSKTITGQLSNLQDGFEQMFNEIGKSTEGVISDSIGIAASLVENWENVGKTILEIVTIYGAYKAAVIAASAVLKLQASGIAAFTAAEKAHYTWLVLTEKAQRLLNKTMLANPYVLLATSVAALGVSMYNLYSSLDDTDRQARKLQKEINKLKEETQNNNKAIQEYLPIAKDAKESTEKRKEAINKLKQAYPEYFKSLTIETARNYDVADAVAASNKEYRKRLVLMEKLARQRYEEAKTNYEKNHPKNGQAPAMMGGTTGYSQSSMSVQELANVKQLKKAWETAQAAVRDYDKTVSNSGQDKINRGGKNKNGGKTNRGGETNKSGNDSVRNIKDETAERNRQIAEYSQSVQEAQAQAELDIRQSQIEGMEKSYEKQKEQIKLNYDRLIAENKKREQDMINALTDAKVLEWQNKHPKATKAETIAYRASLDLTAADLTQEQQAQLEAYNELALKAAIKGNRELVEQQEAAWNEYCAKYGGYMQRRNAIAAKYDAELLKTEAGSAWEATLLKQKAEELDALDEEMRGSATLMGQLFADASERSVAEIQKVIDKAELLMAYLATGKDSNGTATIGGRQVVRSEILDMGISENTLQKLEQSPKEVEALRNAISKLKGELGGRSPFKQLETDIKAATAAIRQGKTSEGISKIGSAVAEFAPAMSEFGQSLGTIFGSDDLGAKIAGVADAMGGLGDAAAGVGQIMSGDIVGGTMAAVNGIASVVGALDGLFGADYSEYEAMKAQYDQLSEVWDVLISKKREYIDIDYGIEAQKVGQEALDLLEQQDAYARRLAQAAADAGASIGSHSIAYRQNRDLGGYLGELRTYMGANNQNEALTQTLLAASAEELREVRDNMYEMWMSLDGDFRAALEERIAILEEQEAVVESMKEAATGVSFDDFYNSYVDLMGDLDAENQDFADNFEQYMRKAIISSVMAEKYKDELRQFYDFYAELAKDGLDEAEVHLLRNWANSLSERMNAEQDNMDYIFGWDDESTRQTTSKGIANASQESVDELNGRATAIQGHTYSIQSHTSAISENMKLLVANSNRILESVLNIEVNTDGLSARMETVESHVKEVRDTINDIALKGIKIK